MNSSQHARLEHRLAQAHRAIFHAASLCEEWNEQGWQHDLEQLQAELYRLLSASLSHKRPNARSPQLKAVSND